MGESGLVAVATLTGLVAVATLISRKAMGDRDEIAQCDRGQSHMATQLAAAATVSPVASHDGMQPDQMHAGQSSRCVGAAQLMGPVCGSDPRPRVHTSYVARSTRPYGSGGVSYRLDDESNYDLQYISCIIVCSKYRVLGVWDRNGSTRSSCRV